MIHFDQPRSLTPDQRVAGVDLEVRSAGAVEAGVTGGSDVEVAITIVPGARVRTVVAHMAVGCVLMPRTVSSDGEEDVLADVACVTASCP
jgi:hypothetical protein